MARINLNDFGVQAGGLANRANQVRTDPAVVKAAQDAWGDVKDASRSCSVLAREASAAWQRSRTADMAPRDYQVPNAPAPAPAASTLAS
jgi:hypothetical protein